MTDPGHILIIDDDPLLRAMLGRALRRLGYSVEECEDGVAGFRALEAAGGNALLVLDYEMPKFNGAQVCEMIRTHSNPDMAQAPIILLTGHTGEDHEIESLSAGADDFVTKPVNLPVLKARIETHLRLSTLRAQLQEQNRLAEEWRTMHERDLEAARLVQQAIIPQGTPVIEGWDLAVRYQSLIQVGGDMYDWLRLPDGSTLFWIADATGHGASAALQTTFTKLLFRYVISEEGDPAAILRGVNRDFRAIFRGRLFFTTTCLRLNPATGELRIAGAGHPPVLLFRGDHVEAIASSAPPIGLLLEEGLPEVTETHLHPGETLLLYTDGLYSIATPEKKHLSFPQFLQALQNVHPKDASDAILSSIRCAAETARSATFDDDLAMIAIHRKSDR